VGKTSTNTDSVGFEARATGLNAMVRASGETLILGRNTSNGSILSFRKDGTTVGSIGSASGVVSYIVLDPRTGVKGAGLLGSSADANTGILQPTDNSGSTADAAIQLGTSSNRFKDLYLSGGIYVGGTGSANHLDDYEEGTWTPTWTNGIGNGSTSGTYVKVGNIVHVTALFTMGSTTSIGNKLEATNLPFNCDSITYSGARYENYQSNSYIGMTRANANVLRGYVINTGGSQATENIASTNAPFTWGVNDYAQFSITYTI
jgi:hypothetical protein